MSSSMSHFPNASNFNVYGGNYIQNTIVNTDMQKDPPGREEALTKLEGFFDPGRAAESTKVFLLYGLGGVGKTQLALEFAKRFKKRSMFTAIFFITADQEDSIQRSYLDIAKNSKSKDPQSWEVGLNWLKTNEENWLVVIDNADNLEIPFSKYLPSCYHGNVIITSRNPDLEVYSNQSLELKGMPAEEGIQLLAKYAMKGVKEIRDEEQEKAAEIAKELHYFPLALVHAGAYINNQHSLSQDLSGYLDRLRKQKQREQLLSNGPRQSKDGYFQSVYETWKISWEQLSPDSQTFLGLLAHLHYENIPHALFERAARNLDMAESPLGPSNAVTEGKAILERIATKLEDIMEDAVSYSLISINKKRQEYTFHPLVHQWLKDIDKDSHRQAIEGIVVLAVGEIPQKDYRLADYVFTERLEPHVRALGDSFTSDYVVKLAIGYIWLQLQLHHYHTATNMSGPLLDIMIERLGLEDSFTLYLESKIVEAYHQPLGRGDELLGLQQKLMEISKEVLGDKHPATLKRKHALACMLILEGETSEALKLQQSLVESSKGVLGEEDFHTWDRTEKLIEILLIRGKTNEALELVKSLLETIKRVLGEEHFYTLVRTQNLVRMLQKAGRINEALKLAQNLLEVLKRVSEKEHSDIKFWDLNIRELAVKLRALGRTDEALGLEQSLLETSKRALGEEHPDTLSMTQKLVETLRVQGRITEALKLGKSLLETLKRALGEEHSNTFIEYWDVTDTFNGTQDLAETLRVQGRTNEALQLQQSLLEVSNRLLEKKHPHVGVLGVVRELAVKLRALGRTDEALGLEQSLLETSKRVLGEEHPDTLSMTQKLVEPLRVQGRITEALKLGQSLLETSKRVLGEEHPHTWDRTQNLAETLLMLGRTNEALELEQSLLETSKRVLGEEHPNTDILDILRELAVKLRPLGRTDEALGLEQSLLEPSKRVLEEEHPHTDILSIIQNLTETLRASGRTDEAFIDHRLISERIQNLSTILAYLGRKNESLELMNALVDHSVEVLGETHPDTLCYIENLKLLESFPINGCHKSETSHLFPLAFLLLLVLGLYSKGYAMLSFIVQTLFQTL
ncbi:hypothetical protein GGU10DRAFT_401387 [Lentinula aff. detonsa]|uniref:TPR-like protein n=1 Tax=Lentinula aff. detonsa TaxID=2804958 RepID=A0AA38KFR6_9AGAR|nr:hypothetical protein GGU10DRAFT_401387 [Lentinula aff. detonsa]